MWIRLPNWRFNTRLSSNSLTASPISPRETAVYPRLLSSRATKFWSPRLFHSPAERRPQVVMLGLQLPQPRGRCRCRQLFLCLLGQRQEKCRVPLPDRRVLSAFAEPPARIRPDRFQQAIARLLLDPFLDHD